MTQLRDYGRQIESDPMLSAEAPRTVDVGTRPPRPRLGRGLAWAVAAFALVLAIGGLYFAFSGDDGQVVDQTTVPTPTTVTASEPKPTTPPAEAEVTELLNGFLQARIAGEGAEQYLKTSPRRRSLSSTRRSSTRRAREPPTSGPNSSQCLASSGRTV